MPCPTATNMLFEHRAIPRVKFPSAPLLKPQIPVPPILTHTKRCNAPYHNDDDSPDSHHRVPALYNEIDVLEGIEHSKYGECENDNDDHVGESIVDHRSNEVVGLGWHGCTVGNGLIGNAGIREV
jgi:hypothetical protein